MFIVQQFWPGAFHRDSADRVDITPISDLKGFEGILFHEEDGHLVLPDLQDLFVNLVHHKGSQAQGRLVEEKKGGPEHEATADSEHLPLTTTQGAGQAFSPFPQDREHVVYHLQLAPEFFLIPPREGS